MADRTSSAAPGGEFGGLLAQMAMKIRGLENDVAQLQRSAYSPGADFLWIVGPDGRVFAKRISTGNQQLVAGPL